MAVKDGHAPEAGRSAVKAMAKGAVKAAAVRSSVLVLDGEPGSAHVSGVIEALEASGYRVDTHTPSPRRDGGLLPIEALRYDVVILSPLATVVPEGRREEPLGDVEIGRLRIDVKRRLVFVDEKAVRMSAREFTLLHHLSSYPTIVFSREALLRAVWGSSWRTEGSVTEYIRRLRMLLEPTGIGECIVTRKGFGYAFDPDAVQ